MKTGFYFLFIGILTGLLLISCQKSELKEYQPNTEGLMVLGEKLENPYSVANMQQAYSNLKSANADIPDYNIETTHVYVRFLPKNMDEIELLEDDTTLELSEVPKITIIQIPKLSFPRRSRRHKRKILPRRHGEHGVTI